MVAAALKTGCAAGVGVVEGIRVSRSCNRSKAIKPCLATVTDNNSITLRE
jgi:hypothetical protein